MLFKQKSIDSVKVHISRDELIRRSRILIIDDEKPELIEDMKSAGFAVDHVSDINRSNISIIEQPRYDLIILDYGSVGRDFGDNEGLSLLKHIKRVNPSIVVLAYTSKLLGTKNADFYRLSDIVLGKDAGIQDSLDKIETGLRLANNPNHIWACITKLLNIQQGSEQDLKLQHQFLKLKSKTNLQKFNLKITGIDFQDVGKSLLVALIEKLFEIIILSKIAG